MKKRIRRFDVLQAGKVSCLIYALIALIMLPFLLLCVWKGSGKGILLMTFLYPVIGFIGGILGAAFYNLISRLIGGLVVDVEDIPVLNSKELDRKTNLNRAML